MRLCGSLFEFVNYFFEVNFSADAAKELLIYSYGRSFNGFAAKLSDEEVERLLGESFQDHMKLLSTSGYVIHPYC